MSEITAYLIAVMLGFLGYGIYLAREAARRVGWRRWLSDTGRILGWIVGSVVVIVGLANLMLYLWGA